MNILTHFEIPSNNLEKTKEFYSELFNWEFNFVEEMGYMMFSIPSSEEPTPMGGGLVKSENGNNRIVNYITVENIDSDGEKIVELGGEIVVPKTPVPGMGWFIHFSDLDGNVMAIWQNGKEAK